MKEARRFRKSYCKDAVTLMQQGFGIASLCRAFDCTKEELKAWAREHDEFNEALKFGFTCLEAFWEERAVEAALGTGKLSPNTVLRGMERLEREAASLKQEYSEKSDKELTEALSSIIHMRLALRDDYDAERDEDFVRRVLEGKS